jgi:hypothetical protein
MRRYETSKQRVEDSQRLRIGKTCGGGGGVRGGEGLDGVTSLNSAPPPYGGVDGLPEAVGGERDADDVMADVGGVLAPHGAGAEEVVGEVGHEGGADKVEGRVRLFDDEGAVFVEPWG